MLTYFARHSSYLDIDDETFSRLWDEDYISIHYPHNINIPFDNGDSCSLNPDDYEGSGRSSLVALRELAEFGGYVFAVYRPFEGGKIGYVRPNSEIELLKGRWGNQNGLDGREAVLKSIKLENVQNLSPAQCISLKSVQPRQGTFVRWHKVGTRVKSLLNGNKELNVGSLTPDLQEVMCMEFLRLDLVSKYGLPILKHTLAPVGRTMKDVDIIGATVEGNKIYAQVTFHQLTDAYWKLNKLNGYSSDENYTLFFCKCTEPQVINGHNVFPIDLVFDEFCIKSNEGANWFEQVK